MSRRERFIQSTDDELRRLEEAQVAWSDYVISEY